VGRREIGGENVKHMIKAPTLAAVVLASSAYIPGARGLAGKLCTQAFAGPVKAGVHGFGVAPALRAVPE
jgi:hypothetical protein